MMAAVDAAAAAETEAATEESLLAEAATEALETAALETVTTEAPETVEAAAAAALEAAKATGKLGLLTEAATEESLLAGQYKNHSISDRLNFLYHHMAPLHTPTWATPPYPP
jgi:hypothetical protein